MVSREPAGSKEGEDESCVLGAASRNVWSARRATTSSAHCGRCGDHSPAAGSLLAPTWPDSTHRVSSPRDRVRDVSSAIGFLSKCDTHHSRSEPGGNECRCWIASGIWHGAPMARGGCARRNTLPAECGRAPAQPCSPSRASITTALRSRSSRQRGGANAKRSSAKRVMGWSYVT